MELIILQGEANRGKTYTLNIAYQLLLQNGYVQVAGSFQSIDGIDFLDVLEHPKTKTKVGIVSQSDNITDITLIKDALLRIEGYEPKKVICTCTLGKGREDMREALTEYNLHVIDKIVAGNVAQQRIVNNWDANKILSHII